MTRRGRPPGESATGAVGASSDRRPRFGEGGCECPKGSQRIAGRARRRVEFLRTQQEAGACRSPLVLSRATVHGLRQEPLPPLPERLPPPPTCRREAVRDIHTQPSGQTPEPWHPPRQPGHQSGPEGRFAALYALLRVLYPFISPGKFQSQEEAYLVDWDGLCSTHR